MHRTTHSILRGILPACLALAALCPVRAHADLTKEELQARIEMYRQSGHPCDAPILSPITRGVGSFLSHASGAISAVVAIGSGNPLLGIAAGFSAGLLGEHIQTYGAWTCYCGMVTVEIHSIYKDAESGQQIMVSDTESFLCCVNYTMPLGYPGNPAGMCSMPALTQLDCLMKAINGVGCW